MIKLPNKLFPYEESVISKFMLVINRLEYADLTPIELYMSAKEKYGDINEFVDVLSCLFALNIIELNNNSVKLVRSC